jgi:hypothetical protein
MQEIDDIHLEFGRPWSCRHNLVVGVSKEMICFVSEIRMPKRLQNKVDVVHGRFEGRSILFGAKKILM